MGIETAAPERMRCMEIWGGNHAVDKSFSAPGLDVYVHSRPYQSSEVGGGDLYYLTSCASGRISRLLLADVSGHGEHASDLATALRDLLRQNVNTISQQRFIEGMNREFRKISADNRFATAVVATHFEPTSKLTLGLAGHPNPLFYRASIGRWSEVEVEPVTRSNLGNLPLGVLEGSTYPSREIDVEPGDMFLLYSDAFIEAARDADEMLGTEGILELLEELRDPRPQSVMEFLTDRVRDLDAGDLQDDDATLVLGQVTSTRVRMRDNLLAPFRLLGPARDNTQLGARASGSSDSRR